MMKQYATHKLVNDKAKSNRLLDNDDILNRDIEIKGTFHFMIQLQGSKIANQRCIVSI